jgi:hypothetical protein
MREENGSAFRFALSPCDSANGIPAGLLGRIQGGVGLSRRGSSRDPDRSAASRRNPYSPPRSSLSRSRRDSARAAVPSEGVQLRGSRQKQVTRNTAVDSPEIRNTLAVSQSTKVAWFATRAFTTSGLRWNRFSRTSVFRSTTISWFLPATGERRGKLVQLRRPRLFAHGNPH